MAPNLEKLQTCNYLLKEITFSNFKSVFKGVCIMYFKAKRNTNMEIGETPKRKIAFFSGWIMDLTQCQFQSGIPQGILYIRILIYAWAILGYSKDRIWVEFGFELCIDLSALGVLPTTLTWGMQAHFTMDKSLVTESISISSKSVLIHA